MDSKQFQSDTKCPFCTPDIGDISFIASENFLAIYNQSPILPGHSLVVPKMHYTSLLELPENLQAEMMDLSVKAVQVLMKAFLAEGFDWTIQDGKAAGQTVGHLHLHLIPRKTGDLPDPGDWYPLLESTIKNIDSSQRTKLNRQEMLVVVERIKSMLP